MDISIIGRRVRRPAQAATFKGWRRPGRAEARGVVEVYAEGAPFAGARPEAGDVVVRHLDAAGKPKVQVERLIEGGLPPDWQYTDPA